MVITIEKLVFGGQGLGRIGNKVVFVWNALPGEEVEIEFIKNKKDFAEAVATKIIKPSPFRKEPLEEHFVSTSPWQIIDWSKENEWKKEMAVETYKKFGKNIFSDINPEITFDSHDLHYRNKMEFNFCELPNGEKSLAFYERGKKIKMPGVGSVMATDEINETAQNILSWVNQHQIPMRSLKALIVRSSNVDHKTIAALFIKDQLNFTDYPKLNEQMIGFELYYSTHKSPASVPTKLLYQTGQNYLEEKILDKKLKYGVFSFFQVNIPVFEIALKDINNFFEKNKPMIDFYSGVGSISIPIIEQNQDAFLVDNCKEAIEFAKENIQKNILTNAEAKAIPAEKITEIIDENKIIVLDPPRAGLHEKVIKTLLEKNPKKIIYLSCNISTQARDIYLLSEKYKLTFCKLYNFFPKTPHIEGLCVLENP